MELNPTSLFSNVKDTSFSHKQTINCHGRLLKFDEPVVMGIINLTTDSFYDGGFLKNPDDAISRAEQMISDGASIIDIGGVSTRPGSKSPPEKEELARLLPSLRLIRKKLASAIISVDTFRAEVAKIAIEEGADIINDISGGTMDTKMFSTIAKHKVPYILMHIKGTPETMQEQAEYDDVVSEVIFYFSEKISQLRDIGVNDIIIDPGFGFGKTLEHNYELLRNLDKLKMFELPVLAGISRKSMVNKVLKISSDKALNGTTVLNTIALLNGANILRVHDVAEAMEAVRLVSFYKEPFTMI